MRSDLIISSFRKASDLNIRNLQLWPSCLIPLAHSETNKKPTNYLVTELEATAWSRECFDSTLKKSAQKALSANALQNPFKNASVSPLNYVLSRRSFSEFSHANLASKFFVFLASRLA